MSLPRSKTIQRMVGTFSYLAAKLWNSLPDILEEVLAYMTLNEELDNMNQRNNFGNNNNIVNM